MRTFGLRACLGFLAAVGRLTAPVVGAEPPMKMTEAPPPRPAEMQSLSLADLEQMAVQGNPTLGQAAAQVQVARGRQLQSGLYPNPTVGYNGEQLGLRGKAAGGEQNGIFIDQTIVT